jgi:hypothetical protein
MKMTGTLCPLMRKRSNSSMPLIAGIWTSVMTHDVSFKRAEFRNSSADANVCAQYPCDLTRLSVAARTDASSSTIEITGTFDNLTSASGNSNPS